MLSPYIYAALAHERHQTFLAQAETDRRNRQARLYRQQAGTPGARRSPLRRRPAWLQPGRSRLPGHWRRSAVRGGPVVLRDGSTVVIRQVRSADALLVADGFARLSARTRQLRFLGPKQALLRNAGADLVGHEPDALRYEITLGPAEEHTPAGALRPGDDRPGHLPNPAAAEPAAVRVTDMRQTKARRSADRLWSYYTYPGWAQRGAAEARLVPSSGSRMKAAVHWTRRLMVRRVCDGSAAKGSVACGGPEAEGAGG